MKSINWRANPDEETTDWRARRGKTAHRVRREGTAIAVSYPYPMVLAGHPKLRNDLRRPTMEEIGYRTDVFSLDGIAGAQREYIRWLLGTCTEEQVAAESILTEDAIDVLATKLRTPLQVQLHLTLALEAGYQIGSRPVSADVVESVLSRQIDDLEPTLTRNGYRLKDLMEQFDAKPAEIKALFSNTLEPAQASELRDSMLLAGSPI